MVGFKTLRTVCIIHIDLVKAVHVLYNVYRKTTHLLLAISFFFGRISRDSLEATICTQCKNTCAIQNFVQKLVVLRD